MNQSTRTQATAQPRNILFICTDQQRFDSLGCNGSTCARTPHIDRLASNGLNFQNHMVANPVCSPSRGSIMTGQHITEHGLWNNGCDLPKHHHTIPQVLRDKAGHQTAHFGKLHLEGIIRRVRPHDPYGFETCEVSEGDQQLIDDSYFRWLRSEHPDEFCQALAQMYSEGHAKGYTNCLPEELSLSAFVTRQATDWLRQGRKADEPFYLSVGYFDPHHAFNPCEPYASAFADVDCGEPLFDEAGLASKPAQYQRAFEGMKKMTRDPAKIGAVRRAYHAMCAHIDKCVGDLLATLEQLGLAENTLVIFTSDHGEMLGEHGLLWKGGWMLDELLRVPLIVNVPGAPLGGRVVNELTSAVDFFATFQSVAGVEPGSIERNSGRPFLGGDLSLFPEGKRDYVMAQWEHHKPADSSSLRCIRTEKHKLVHYNNSEQGEFYCLEEDPREVFNRFGDPAVAEAQRDLTERLTRYHLSYRPHTRHLGGW